MVLPPPPKRAFKNVFTTIRGKVYKPRKKPVVVLPPRRALNRVGRVPHRPHVRRLHPGSMFIVFKANSSMRFTRNPLLSICPDG